MAVVPGTYISGHRDSSDVKWAKGTLDTIEVTVINYNRGGLKYNRGDLKYNRGDLKYNRGKKKS